MADLNQLYHIKCKQSNINTPIKREEVTRKDKKSKI